MQKIDFLINRKDCDYSLIKLKKLTIIKVEICKKYVYITNNMYISYVDKYLDILIFGFLWIWISETAAIKSV